MARVPVFHCLFGLSMLSFFSLFCRYQQNYHLPKYSTPVSLLTFESFLVLPVAGSSLHLGLAYGVGELLGHPVLPYLWFSAKYEHIWRTEMEASESSVCYGDAVGQELWILGFWYVPPKPYPLTGSYFKTQYNMGLKSCWRVEYIPRSCFYDVIWKIVPHLISMS